MEPLDWLDFVWLALIVANVALWMFSGRHLKEAKEIFHKATQTYTDAIKRFDHGIAWYKKAEGKYEDIEVLHTQTMELLESLHEMPTSADGELKV